MDALKLYQQLVEEANRSQVVYLPREGYPLIQIERDAILQALVLAGGNMTEAGKLLGLSPKAMRHKVRVVHRLPLPHHRKGLPRASAPPVGPSRASSDTD